MPKVLDKVQPVELSEVSDMEDIWNIDPGGPILEKPFLDIETVSQIGSYHVNFKGTYERINPLRYSGY